MGNGGGLDSPLQQVQAIMMNVLIFLLVVLALLAEQLLLKFIFEPFGRFNNLLPFILLLPFIHFKKREQSSTD